MFGRTGFIAATRFPGSVDEPDQLKVCVDSAAGLVIRPLLSSRHMTSEQSNLKRINKYKYCIAIVFVELLFPSSSGKLPVASYTMMFLSLFSYKRMKPAQLRHEERR